MSREIYKRARKTANEAAEGGHTAEGDASTGNIAGDSDTMDEAVDPDYMPTEDEIVEYAKWLGMDLEKDKDLLWVAKKGLVALLARNRCPASQEGPVMSTMSTLLGECFGSLFTRY